MTWRDAVAEVIAHVRATYTPIGIVIAGSLVRGEGGPHSDLDVCVVHDPPWRLRDQRRFGGVPVEIFVNPAAQVRRYFEREHLEGRPSTAHMFATGEPVPPVAPEIAALIAEAHDWLARPLAIDEAGLAARRYAAVDLLDDARDVVDRDPAATALLLAQAVRAIVEYAFWARRVLQPLRKDAIAALAALDPEAAALVEAWTSCQGREALTVVEALAGRVLGVDTFFPWTSGRDPV